MSFITSYCRIKNNSVALNGETLFSSKGSSEEFATALYLHMKIHYPKFYKMDTQSKFGFLAAELLLANKPVTDSYGWSVILSNSASSLDTDIHYQAASQKAPSPALFVYTLPNIVAGEICIRHGIRGESNFFVSPAYNSNLLSSYLNALLVTTIHTSLAGWIEVLGEEADVFLYLIENSRSGLALEHTPENLNNLYHLNHG